MRSVRSLILGLTAGAGFMLAAPDAFAHAHLIASSPAANATIASPSSITLTFNDPLEPRFSGFEITDAQNHPLGAASHPDPSNGAVYTAVLARPLAPGLYHVNWHLVAHDGHRMRGTFDFTVR